VIMRELTHYFCHHYRRAITVLATGTLMAISGSGYTADQQEPNSTASNSVSIASANVGASLSEKVDLLLINDCDRDVELQVLTAIISGDDSDGEISVETLELAHESIQYMPIMLPGPDATVDGRRYISLGISAPSGPCTAPGKGYLRAAIAVENFADGTVRRSAGLRSDGDLVQAVAEAKRNKLFVGGLAWATDDNGLVRVGEGEAAHLVMRNHCDTALAYRVLLRSPGAEEQPQVPDGVLEAGAGAIIPLGEGQHGKWIDVLSVSSRWPVHDTDASATGTCQKTGISASVEIYDSNDGSTRHAERSRGFGFVDFRDEPLPDPGS
jgi:hypothetical protein